MAAFCRPAGKVSATIRTIAPANIATRVRSMTDLNPVSSARFSSITSQGDHPGGPSPVQEVRKGGQRSIFRRAGDRARRPIDPAPLRSRPERARTLDMSPNRRSGFPRRKRVEEDSVRESLDKTGRGHTCRPAGRSLEWFYHSRQSACHLLIDFDPGKRHSGGHRIGPGSIALSTVLYC
jgi:hypothetical protein